MYKRIALPLILALASASSYAATAPVAPTAAPAPAADATAIQSIPMGLSPAIQKGYKPKKSFPAISGLTGWLMETPNGDYQIFYTTTDGQAMIVGNLVAAAGNDLTQEYGDKYIPKPDLTALWGRFEKATVINSGPTKGAKSSIYVIFDPNCIFCHLLWIALKPYEAAGLQVHWIPVGFLKADSAGKAAALLKGGDAVLSTSQETFDEAKESAGVPAIEIAPDMKAKLDANLSIMRDAQVKGTPGIFFKDAKGVISRKDGMPKMNDLPGITGLPKQEETDPQLARFAN